MAAVARKRGFLDTIAGRLTVHELDGRWSTTGAEKALGEWFRVGAERDRPLDLVVCQNDAMASGARSALLRQAASSGRWGWPGRFSSAATAWSRRGRRWSPAASSRPPS